MTLGKIWAWVREGHSLKVGYNYIQDSWAIKLIEVTVYHYTKFIVKISLQIGPILIYITNDLDY